MSILDRFATIIKANINELLDKAEDPAKMVDQYLIDLGDSLAKVKEETAGVMAEEKRCQRLVDDNEAEAKRMEDLAKKALSAGNEDDARVFLAKKQQLEANGEELKKAADAARANAAESLAELNEKPADDVETLEAKYAGIADSAAVDEELAKLKAEMGL